MVADALSVVVTVLVTTVSGEDSTAVLDRREVILLSLFGAVCVGFVELVDILDEWLDCNEPCIVVLVVIGTLD